MGHDPDYNVIKYAAPNIKFWGNFKTVYTKNDYYKDCLFYKLFECRDIRKRFTSFNIINQAGNTEYNQWSDILIHKTYLKSSKV
jgi:hypothetical protein